MTDPVQESISIALSCSQPRAHIIRGDPTSQTMAVNCWITAGSGIINLGRKMPVTVVFEYQSLVTFRSPVDVGFRNNPADVETMWRPLLGLSDIVLDIF